MHSNGAACHLVTDEIPDREASVQRQIRANESETSSNLDFYGLRPASDCTKCLRGPLRFGICRCWGSRIRSTMIILGQTRQARRLRTIHSAGTGEEYFLCAPFRR